MSDTQSPVSVPNVGNVIPAIYEMPDTTEAEVHADLREAFRKRGVFGGKNDVPRGADGKFVSPAAATPQPQASEDSSPSPAADAEGTDEAEPRHAESKTTEKDTQTSKAENRWQSLSRENKALREKAARLEAERKALIEEQKKAKRERAEEAILSLKLPDGHEDWSDERRTAWIASQAARMQMPPEDLEELRRGVLESKVQRALRSEIQSDDQLAAVMDVLDTHPSLTPREALALATVRSPDLFIDEEPEPEEEAPKPPPPTHRVTEPSQSSRSRAPGNDPAKKWSELATSPDRAIREKAVSELLKIEMRTRGMHGFGR